MGEDKTNSKDKAYSKEWTKSILAPEAYFDSLYAEAIYQIYWHWSMIACIMAGSLAEAQKLMFNNTEFDGEARRSRKMIFKAFSEIGRDPEKSLDQFIKLSFYHECEAERPTYKQTGMLLENLLRRNMISEKTYSHWKYVIEVTLEELQISEQV